MQRGNVRAIVSTVVKDVGSPCRKTRVTVSVVPVDGAQVMLKGVPAVIEVRVVNVKGFWALVIEKRLVAARRRVVVRCILAGFLFLIFQMKYF